MCQYLGRALFASARRFSQSHRSHTAPFSLPVELSAIHRVMFSGRFGRFQHLCQLKQLAQLNFTSSKGWSPVIGLSEPCDFLNRLSAKPAGASAFNFSIHHFRPPFDTRSYSYHVRTIAHILAWVYGGFSESIAYQKYAFPTIFNREGRSV